ncbi:probable N-acetyltransferase HLS1 [Phalaenopsis equestris]|uniref:probable N-acetyltransferase HLS1 n=1 Tax=Phalaenopsis equestris TaxID=78828 RepID=UPI0009E5F9C0|nr:probable N-acetyltransferase HLS1 [Phalaenopsis equestris]
MKGTEQEKMVIVVREYEDEKDREGADAVDRICEVGPSSGAALFTDHLGDPVCRVRHTPAFIMLVAEMVSPERQIVGLIRGCVKSVVCGEKAARRGGGSLPIHTKAAYILGLRVSPSHRRLGIGLKLVQRMEEWFISKGAEYSYMATDKDNKPSFHLFTDRLHYSKFRTPTILVHPVFAGHRLPLPRTATLIPLSPSDAELLYRRRFSTVEFFPRDIDDILRNSLSLGTFLALPSTTIFSGIESFLSAPPESWAVLSVWDCKSLFRLEIRGAPLILRSLAWTSRAVDRALPWLKIPSFPNLFRSFGGYFLYGLGGEGPAAKEFLRALCLHAHNMARADGCDVVATEVAACEPLMDGIPHWKRLSCAEDLWCIKRLADDYSDGAVGDWTRSPPGKSMFFDPREV